VVVQAVSSVCSLFLKNRWLIEVLLGWKPATCYTKHFQTHFIHYFENLFVFRDCKSFIFLARYTCCRVQVYLISINISAFIRNESTYMLYKRIGSQPPLFLWLKQHSRFSVRSSIDERSLKYLLQFTTLFTEALVLGTVLLVPSIYLGSSTHFCLIEANISLRGRLGASARVTISTTL
jgi:hypothetical protein